MRKTKTVSELRAMIEGEGLRMLSVHTGGSGHLIATVEAPCGARMRLTAPSTAGDHRSALNRRADLRRFARARQQGHAA